MNLVRKAALFAEKAHAGQIRKYTGEPYFTHVEAVAKMVAEAGGTEAMVAAAYLHDTVEDTPVTSAEIAAEFGPEVAKLVEELTHVYTSESYPELNRAARKKLEAHRLARVSIEAKLIKVADLEHNTGSIVEHDPEFAKVFLAEKAVLLTAMGV